MTVPELADVRLPERFGSLELIARGGMGVVYRARDESLGRDVAIKVLAREHAADDDVTERFIREARAAARLSGVPNVVIVYDVGGFDEQPFIVMAYLPGGSLEQPLAREGPQPVGRTLTWLAQAARALDGAHKRGVIHRDVKPANLLLDADEVAYVADFGVASAVGMRSLTAVGAVLGTAGYLAPEQAQGLRAGAASDRYALAVVAFELLAGSRPFAAESWTAEAVAHVNAPVPSLCDRRRELPCELDPVFERALAKDPADRYPSCAAFVEAIRRTFAETSDRTVAFQPAAPVAPPPAHTGDLSPAALPHRRRPRWPWLLVPLAAAGVVAAILLTRGTSTPAPAHRTGTKTRAAAPARTGTRPATTSHAGTGSGSASGAALNNQGYALMQRGDYRDALPLLERAQALLQGTNSLDEAYTDYNLAYTRLQLGGCDGVVSLLHRSQSLQRYRPEITQALAEARTRC